MWRCAQSGMCEGDEGGWVWRKCDRCGGDKRGTILWRRLHATL